MTAPPQRRYLPALPQVRRRRMAPVLTPVAGQSSSSVIAWAWYVDGVRRPAASLTEAARSPAPVRVRLVGAQGPR